MTSTPVLATTLARRLNARGYYAVALAVDTPTVHVNLTGHNRAEVQVVWDEEYQRNAYRGTIFLRSEQIGLVGLSHSRLEQVLARY